MAEILCLQCLGNGGEMVERCCENPLYINKRDCCCIGINEWVECEMCGGIGKILSMELPTPSAPAQPVADR